jgi:hypothetical protein
VVVGYNIFKKCKRKSFCFQNALVYSWLCKFLQRWRCNSQL